MTSRAATRPDPARSCWEVEWEGGLARHRYAGEFDAGLAGRENARAYGSTVSSGMRSPRFSRAFVLSSSRVRNAAKTGSGQISRPTKDVGGGKTVSLRAVVARVDRTAIGDHRSTANS